MRDKGLGTWGIWEEIWGSLQGPSLRLAVCG